VPVFKRQQTTGRLTITDERMTRFWITLEQGVKFVIRAVEVMQGGEVFVPKIPSMRLTDLAEAIAPGCEQDIIGIRPGEKLHELLVSRDESRHTLEFEDMFIIQPAHPWWKPTEYKDATPLQQELEYGSDNNDRWLSATQLTAMIDES
jgi:UDP-N-acetylglucosamine 4,6-dehydratase